MCHVLFQYLICAHVHVPSSLKHLPLLYPCFCWYFDYIGRSTDRQIDRCSIFASVPDLCMYMTICRQDALSLHAIPALTCSEPTCIQQTGPTVPICSLLAVCLLWTLFKSEAGVGPCNCPCNCPCHLFDTSLAVPPEYDCVCVCVSSLHVNARST